VSVFSHFFFLFHLVLSLWAAVPTVSAPTLVFFSFLMYMRPHPLSQHIARVRVLSSTFFLFLPSRFIRLASRNLRNVRWPISFAGPAVYQLVYFPIFAIGAVHEDSLLSKCHENLLPSYSYIKCSSLLFRSDIFHITSFLCLFPLLLFSFSNPPCFHCFFFFLFITFSIFSFTICLVSSQIFLSFYIYFPSSHYRNTSSSARFYPDSLTLVILLFLFLLFFYFFVIHFLKLIIFSHITSSYQYLFFLSASHPTPSFPPAFFSTPPPWFWEPKHHNLSRPPPVFPHVHVPLLMSDLSKEIILRGCQSVVARIHLPN